MTILPIPTIITCALTGSGDTTAKNPAVPVTPEEVATSGIAAARAGAAIIHIHVRDLKTRLGSMNVDSYREVVERVRDSGVDVVINLTTGPGARFVPGDPDPKTAGPGSTITTPERRVEHILALRPEICSLDMGSMNFGPYLFANTPAHLSTMAASIREDNLYLEKGRFGTKANRTGRPKFLGPGLRRDDERGAICKA